MLFDHINKCLRAQPDYSYDEACVDIINTLSEKVWIMGQYSQCHECNYQNITAVGPNDNTSILTYTRYPIELYYVLSNNSIKCNFSKLLGEHYRYGWNITEKCTPIYIKEEADSAYLPILTAFIIFFFFGTFWYFIKCIYKNSGRLRRLFVSSTTADFETDLGSSSGTALTQHVANPPKIRKHPNRLKSIDVFRGLCIILMIFVNYGGGKYWFFSHAAWNGLTVADLVFPWFMWLMGMSMAISMQSKLRRGASKREMLIAVMRRSFILIFLGVVLNSHKSVSTVASIRFPGVLQRLGICYLIVALLEITFTKRLECDNLSTMHDVFVAWPQWNFITLLVVIHTCVTFFVKIPGCGKGYLGPGGLDAGGKFENCTGGVAGYIDRQVFGEHMYKTPACRKLYETTVYYDPEGILGTLTAIVTVYFGVQAGRTLHTFQSVKGRVTRWTTWGVILCLLGGALCEFKQDDGLIPVNKQLWSLSFVFVLSGLAFFVQAFLFVLVDITKKWGGRPFFYPGMNAILLYIGHELFTDTFPFAWKPDYSSHSTYLFMNLWGTTLWIIIAICLYKNNYFFSL